MSQRDFKTEVKHYPLTKAHGEGAVLCSCRSLGAPPPPSTWENNQLREHTDEENEAEEKQKKSVGHGERRKPLAQSTTSAAKPANIELTFLSHTDSLLYKL